MCVCVRVCVVVAVGGVRSVGGCRRWCGEGGGEARGRGEWAERTCGAVVVVAVGCGERARESGLVCGMGGGGGRRWRRQDRGAKEGAVDSGGGEVSVVVVVRAGMLPRWRRRGCR